MFGIGRCVGESAASEVVCLFFTILTIAVLIRVLLSWFQMDPRSPLIEALNSITDPILVPLRNILPRVGMFDLSPIVAMILLSFISAGLQQFVDDLVL